MNHRFIFLIAPIILISATTFSFVAYLYASQLLVSHATISPSLPRLLGPEPGVPLWQIGAPVSYTNNASSQLLKLTFVGDVLLARSVESLMRRNGDAYPFLHTAHLFASSTAVFANFEAAIPLIHSRTPAYATSFSVTPSAVAALAESGVTHVSLANNHSNDFGERAFAHTRAVLAANNIVPFGHSSELATSSVTFVAVGSTTVAVVALHTVFDKPDAIQLARLVGYMQARSDVQIVYVHGGTEYSLLHSRSQEELAEYLVTLGIDVIIGHHPHVTEDIGLVHGVPVFYSLGNFIFDQYFSDAVQQGLVVSLEVQERDIVISLIPVTSEGTHAQPRPMVDSERQAFLADLAKRSDPTLAPSILQGRLVFPRSLAE